MEGLGKYFGSLDAPRGGKLAPEGMRSKKGSLGLPPTCGLLKKERNGDLEAKVSEGRSSLFLPPVQNNGVGGRHSG